MILKHFIFSGRKIPRTGGVILANLSTRQEVDSIIGNDPFYVNHVANYEIIEFQPTMFDEEFSVFMNNAYT
ncbi:YciI family protein [Paenibacillus sp. GCM10027628]|uniref:YciI family protein n=1 Tax=Paenibacillus sp. GCM10027628 TaxID=3273413 RepID=UPI0036448363